MKREMRQRFHIGAFEAINEDGRWKVCEVLSHKAQRNHLTNPRRIER